jgi:hypothetical protein
VIRATVAALALALPSAAVAAEKFAVLAVGDLPAGPDGDLTELTHQLRAACRDRVPNVLDSASMRARLLGQMSSATESELDRAYGGALAVYQNGESESALRTLRAIVSDLESLPETDESYFQWKRALLQVAVAANAARDQRELEAALATVARIEPNLQPDPDQFSPGFRKRFEEIKGKVRNLPRRKLTVTAEGRQGMVYVNGKPMGISPLGVTLPSGVYRVGGAAGSLRVPSLRVDLEQEDRTVVLDFALAESLRLNAGPGLALPAATRANGVIRAGAWLGVDKLIVVTRAEEGQAQFLVGGIYDVLRGSLLREGSVRMVAGGVPSVNLSALAAFLLTGQASREVKELSRDRPKKAAPPALVAAPPPPDATAAVPSTQPDAASAPLAAAAQARSPEPTVAVSPEAAQPSPAPATSAPANPDLLVRSTPAPADPLQIATAAEPASDAGPRRGSWKKGASIGAGVLALGLGALAVQQNAAAADAYSSAGDQLTSDRTFKSVSSQQRFYSLNEEGDRAKTNATIAAAGAAVFAVTAVVLGWSAWRSHPSDGATLKVEF